jgi:hypothetical protein
VKQDRGEEEQSGDYSHPEVGPVREPVVLRREHAARERPDDEHENDQPAPVDPDADAGDPAELDAAGHVRDATTVRLGMRSATPAENANAHERSPGLPDELLLPKTREHHQERGAPGNGCRREWVDRLQRLITSLAASVNRPRRAIGASRHFGGVEPVLRGLPG